MYIADILLLVYKTNYCKSIFYIWSTTSEEVDKLDVFSRMLIAGKVALITGGVGGLGKAFASALLKARASAVSIYILHIVYL